MVCGALVSGKSGGQEGVAVDAVPFVDVVCSMSSKLFGSVGLMFELDETRRRMIAIPVTMPGVRAV